LNQLIHRTQCDVFLWEILDVNIINAHPRPRQHHPCSRRLRGHPQDGRRKRSTDSTQASTLKFRFRPDNVVVQIIDPLVGAASCQGLRGKAPLARRATAAVAVAAAAGRPGRCGRQEREGSETQRIVNMMIVLELECLVSRQWQEQIRGFQPGQPAGCSWKKFFGCRNIQEYQGI